jgi:hypothetical protein
MSQPIMPIPFMNMPAPGEPLTDLHFRDTMGLLLAQSHGLANAIYTASHHPDGAPENLAGALEVLEQYIGCTLDLFLRWRGTGRGSSCPEEEAHD